jgi:hypothetical protein
MNWIDTSKRSSTIARLGYEPRSLTLQIAFKSGGLYSYSRVSPNDFHTFISQPSLGHAYNSMFYAKPLVHPSQTLRSPKQDQS